MGDVNVAFSDAQAYVAKLPLHSLRRTDSSSKCIVAFRGSVDLLNYYHDFNFVPAAWPTWKDANMSICPFCQAHVGVAQAYEVLRVKMHAYLKELHCESVAITGHSLGAGVATLASAELRALGVVVEPVYTFGKLRVGNQAFAQKFVSDATKQNVSPPMWRIVNGHDPVPRLPPHWLEHQFVHEPVEVYYPSEHRGDYKVCNWSMEALEDPSCSDSVKVEDCIGNPGYDHNHYVGLSTMVENLPHRCAAPDAPVWSI
jgi:triacylglycerol lipase